MRGNRNPNFGKELSSEVRVKISNSQRGPNAHNWRGGIAKENTVVRNSVEYKLWREAVYKRDNWTCVFCGRRGVRIQADHIKPFAHYPELRFAIDNGRTLCVPCHKTTETYGGKYMKKSNLGR